MYFTQTKYKNVNNTFSLDYQRSFKVYKVRLRPVDLIKPLSPIIIKDIGKRKRRREQTHMVPEILLVLLYNKMVWATVACIG